ncbi:unnamed protein product [Linum tenue]|uniref:Uncharacterized protein n=1 Tax=Linum tenue TaxID=586396 RepID=A0AAV0KRD3_9ROSI|nr:unnamed protein product [Linum tenue]
MMEHEDNYTKDGTVDIHGKPANKLKTGNWKACRFILGNECCERLAYYGMSTNLVNFLQERLNMGNVAASTSVTNWSGTCYVTPLIGAFLADAYLGRFWTIAGFVIVYICGMSLLTMSSAVPGLRPSCNGDSCHATSSQTAVCFVALYLIALGTGGIKPCVSSFGADQFDENDESEKKKKMEFFYDQAPDAMRSLCSALSLTTVALGNYLSTLLVTVVTDVTTKGGKLGWIPDNLNRGHLDYFYWLLAILSLVNFFVYLWIAKWYTYKNATGRAH